MSAAEQDARAEISSLHDLAMVIEDRDVAERLIRVTGAIVAAHDLHEVDARLRCLLCRPSGRLVLWRRRQPCTVREVLEDYRLDVWTLRGACG
jgi:hypothetical protein